MVTVLRDIYLDADKIESYFDDVVPVDLWRAKRKGADQDIFHLVEEKFMLSSGRPRDADITIEPRDDVPWVHVDTAPRGISTWDRSGTFKGKAWEYFRIPAGTELPEGLAVTKDYFNPRVNAWHYTIAPARDMPLQIFKDLLRRLAAKLIKEVA